MSDRAIAPSSGQRRKPQGSLRGRPRPFTRLWQRAVHLVSYCANARTSTADVNAAGFRLLVPPTVFHPRRFRSSEFFAEFVNTLNLRGLRVADVGTGCGILALAAIRAGAASVVATDINPLAARATAENARINSMPGCVTTLACNLLAATVPRPTFDVILASLPDQPREPMNVADRSWSAGSRFRDVAGLFRQAGERLRPGGRLFVLLSTNSDLAAVSTFVARAGMQARLVLERSQLMGSMLIYEIKHARTLPSRQEVRPDEVRRRSRA
jgi:release factor glutamine methyltransferase